MVCALFVLAMEFFCLVETFAAAPTKYVVGYATHTARVLPLWLAGEQGFYLKNGIDIDPVFIRGAPTLVAGLAAGSIALGRTGGAATLGAVSAGHDFKIVATFSSHNTYDLVVRPNIKRAEDLRGKTFAVTSIGGTSWMGVLLWLEHLGLDQQRDNIRFQVIGDQAVQVQCVVNALCDAAAVDGVFTKQLKAKGMNVLAEYSDLKASLISQGVVVPGALLQQRPGHPRELHQRRNRSSGLFSGAEKQTGGDQEFDAQSQGRFVLCRRCLPGSASRRRSKAGSVPRRTAQRPAASENA